MIDLLLIFSFLVEFYIIFLFYLLEKEKATSLGRKLISEDVEKLYIVIKNFYHSIPRIWVILNSKMNLSQINLNLANT